MIVIVIGTNRPNAISKIIAENYRAIIHEKYNEESIIIDLEKLPEDFIITALYHNAGKNALFNIFREIIETHEKFIFIIPEYNGSFPGVLKAFVDGLKYPDALQYKKAALVGLSSGVQGGAMALSHFSDVLSFMNVNQIGLQVKLGNIKQYLLDGKITFDIYNQLIDKQINQLINF